MKHVESRPVTDSSGRSFCQSCGQPAQPVAAFAENVQRINVALSAVQNALDAQERMIEGLLVDPAVPTRSRYNHGGVDRTPTSGSSSSRPLDAAHRQALALLTPREREVLVLVAQGKSNRQVANFLRISEKTVKNHLSALFSKIGASDRTQAVVFGIRGGVVTIGESPGIVRPFSSAPEEPWDERSDPPGSPV
ncbi:response regulator transcription factor [Streptomyces sp. NPDC006879]|uniref:response regulator transcription factor n=1 Tax=Streptomyces sp. NPDC006879 TaxID=3364767 RepID=UPI00368D3082